MPANTAMSNQFPSTRLDAIVSYHKCPFCGGTMIARRAEPGFAADYRIECTRCVTVIHLPAQLAESATRGQ